MMHHRLPSFTIGLLCMLAAASATAEEYPTRSIRMLVGFAVGGSTDISARVLAPRLAEALGQQVVVDNRPGGGTIIATDTVAKAPPDGYTMFMANISFGANPAIVRKLPFDTEKDFAPISMIATIPTVLAVHPSVPAKTVNDLLRLARAKPGGLNYASAGNASANHLIMEVFKSMTKTNMVHIAYKGGGPAVVDLVGGQISVMFATVPSSVQHYKSGRLVALGVSTTQRVPALPDVPTVAESGVPGFAAFDWQGLFVPAATPQAVIDRLHRETVSALAHPDVKERFVALGAFAGSSTPKELAAHLRSEITRWIRIAKEADIRAD